MHFNLLDNYFVCFFTHDQIKVLCFIGYACISWNDTLCWRKAFDLLLNLVLMCKCVVDNAINLYVW